jgi:hypothetical protein
METLRNAEEWRILARLCNVEKLLNLYEAETISLESWEEWYSKMQFYSDVSGGGLIAMETQTPVLELIHHRLATSTLDSFSQVEKG